MGSAGIGHHPPFLRSVGSAGPFVTDGAVGLAALGPAGALAGQPVAAVGAASDRPRPRGGLGRVAFGVQLHHHPRAQGRVVLGPADPLGQLPTRTRPDGELAVV